MDKKIKSVLELSRYKIDETAWWVVLRQKQVKALKSPSEAFILRYQTDISTADLNYKLTEYHPKNLFVRTVANNLPHLNSGDFGSLLDLLNSEIVVEEFTITDIRRSNNTGEFLYKNRSEEWMPEVYLFDTIVAARKEKRRLLKKISSWIESNA